MGKVMVTKCGAIAVFFFIVAAACLKPSAYCQNAAPTPAAVKTVSGLLCAVAGFLWLDVTLLRPADSHSIKTLLQQYFNQRLGAIVGHLALIRFSSASKQIRKCQHDLLMDIISANKNTEFGHMNGFSAITSVEEYIAKVPFVKFFPDYDRYIDRLAKGDENILTSYPVECFAITSGTTGKSKRIPITANRRRRFLGSCGFLKLLNTNIGSLKRTLSLRYKPSITHSQCGIPIKPISFHLAPAPASYTVVPDTVIAQMDNCSATEYISALFALAEKELVYLDTLLAPNCYTFFRTIEDEASRLVADLSRGLLSHHVEVSDKIRNAVNCSLAENPQRAEEVLREIRVGSIGLAKRLWPCLEHVGMASSGSFATSARLLEATYIKGVSHNGYVHVSSESLLGFTLHNVTKQATPPIYACAVHAAFFEFIPETELDQENPKTLAMHQIEVGRSYEIVLTTADGLYRYRMGDVIAIVGFHNQCPLYTFEYRSGHVLNVRMSRMTEARLFDALIIAQRKWAGPQFVDFTATESYSLENASVADAQSGSQDKRKVHYIIFVEVFAKREMVLLSEEQKAMIDEGLSATTPEYRTERQHRTFDQARVIQVKTGTFAAIKSVMTRENKSYQQFKMPRVVRAPYILAMLLDSDVALGTVNSGSHTSTDHVGYVESQCLDPNNNSASMTSLNTRGHIDCHG